MYHEIWSDIDTHLLANDGPYVPRSVEDVRTHLAKRDDPDGPVRAVWLTAETLDGGEFVGGCGLWGIDRHNLVAHLGISLRPGMRGKGYGRDMIKVLCDLGFRLHGLHRLELETLAINTGMRTVAEKCGFVLEGIQRQRDYIGTGFGDIALYGQLRDEWLARGAGQ
jgi:RimJ/RimL family protein N-acetyltransferase